MLVTVFIAVVLPLLYLFYRDYKTIDKLTKEIGELSAEIEMISIDLEGEKIFSKLYQKFWIDSNIRESDLQKEIEILQQYKNVKKSSKEEKKNKKTKK